MPHKVLMPALSPTMTEGKLAKWLKKEGDKVKAGQVIAEIETDKATMEVEAVDEGTLGKILVPAGTDGVKVNTLIAVLLEDGESAADIAKVSNTNTAAPPAMPPTALRQSMIAGEAGGGGIRPAPKAQSINTIQTPPMHALHAKHAGGVADVLAGKRLRVSPLARRIAREKGIDLSVVKGSGPHGRIVRADLDSMPPAASRQSMIASEAGGGGIRTPPSGGVVMPGGPNAQTLADAYGIPYKLLPNSGVRKVIAKRLLESKQTVPHFYLTVDCEIDALLSVRKELNDAAQGYKISVNDFIIKAAAAALMKYPAANVSWTEEAILQYERADISVAVATPGGLITPIIKDAAAKSLKDISGEMKDLAARAKDGKLKPQEFQGGTISVSNLGMFGIREFGAIINPPQGAILAVGAGEQRPVIKDGQVRAATVMTVTLSVDHRCIDGAVGAEFLQIFKKLIESPMSLIL